jgi:hypothetical protein
MYGVLELTLIFPKIRDRTSSMLRGLSVLLHFDAHGQALRPIRSIEGSQILIAVRRSLRLRLPLQLQDMAPHDLEPLLDNVTEQRSLSGQPIRRSPPSPEVVA